ncbi:dTDP-4-dehydrorhamnose reductase [Pseudomonas linyingensis]|uniref:dTDP-4-dehydrorhamnose reductase n=1 Tax=Pseudomonas linyingensis TaxID=915471 RepID=A0A1H6X9D3_9PSED|nr:dTDP-4-dehydrorhamnose reductase [Pseudomonas linyingensis]SEJ25801.1 dTDP-4-dehydrorhamnose reductase [Pseudomonas linyingensis]
MRVLITGARGQVGHELLRLAPEGFQVHGLGSTALDIGNAAQVAKVVAEFQPQLIINAAAYTAVDKAESDAERAWAVNRDGVANLAIAAERLGIPVFHISTDYVFAGDAREPYRESDPVGPTGVYGASKLGGEVMLAANCSRNIILRTSWVFGAHGNNFVKTMLRLGREREELGVVADQHGCPTSAASIARALWTLAVQYRDHGALQWGVYHYAGTPACTWHEFALEIFRQAHELGLLERVPVVRAIATTDYPTPATRPAWSVLDCSKLHEAHDIAQADWREELGLVLRELA